MRTIDIVLMVALGLALVVAGAKISPADENPRTGAPTVVRLR